MTSYNTVDNYSEGSITGTVIKIINPKEFFLKDDDGYTYYCIITRKNISAPTINKKETYYGLIENEYRCDKKYPIEMLVRA